MGSLFKPSYSTPLPADADIVTRNGRRFVRMKVDGRETLYPVSKNGKSYLRKTSKWYGRYTNERGKVVDVPLSKDRAAAKQMLADLERREQRLGRLSLTSPEDRLKASRLRLRTISFGPFVHFLDGWCGLGESRPIRWRLCNWSIRRRCSPSSGGIVRCAD